MPESQPEPPKRKRGRPPAAQAGGQEDIKNAALRAFAKTGFKGTSIDQIADAAGVAKPLIHYHFKNKEALWYTCVSEAYDQFRLEVMTFAQQVQRSPPDDLFLTLSTALVQLGAEKPFLLEIALDETRQGSERGAWLTKTYLLQIHQIMIPAMSLMAPQHPDIRTAAAHIVPALHAAINFPFLDADTIRKAYGTDVFSDAYIEEHSRYIAMLIRASFKDQTS